VLGGGVSKAAKFYMPALLREVRADMHTLDGRTMPRVPSYVYNLEDPQEFEQFVHGQTKEIEVHGTGRRIRIDTQRRLGITLSQLGTSRATNIGAYCFALHALDDGRTTR
jgi:glucokinase